jgi:hypothetical protein
VGEGARKESEDPALRMEPKLSLLLLLNQAFG